MALVSAGLLMHRIQKQREFFLIHPGGPFFKNKNEGAWTIPKGLVEGDEDLLMAASREFEEETGIKPHGPFEELGAAKLKSGKLIHVWSFPGDWEEGQGIRSNTFSLEWPPRSGKFIDVPEADRAQWFNYEQACKHINPAQIVFLERLVQKLAN
jgi:predicted NUDIX family NTP pyrophosphohydrolase